MQPTDNYMHMQVSARNTTYHSPDCDNESLLTNTNPDVRPILQTHAESNKIISKGSAESSNKSNQSTVKTLLNSLTLNQPG